MDDERVFNRISFTEPLSALLYLDSDESVFLSTDRSNKGLRIEGGVEFEVGEKILLVFDLSDDRFVEGEGSVQWSGPLPDGRFSAGIELSTGPNSNEPDDFAEHERQPTDRPPLGVDEKRIYPRSKQSTKVYSGGIVTSVYDLSEAGCCIATELPIDPGTFIALVFSAKNRIRIKFHGKIKWCRKEEVSGGKAQHGVEVWHINEVCRDSYSRLLRGLSR